ncbi:TetR family transcriptional regulator [Nocardiopsis dassonvillei]|jgi:AcrR family transcriptional regulator|uniref:TetR/AcrR family transcriptional regulator n=1 Tax=Nocardiopsis dassonvillei TaxID=2014 RepID=UPI00102CB0FD|nr:TetR family transcriptional regulator [Nocardiopsis dassonvillei]MCP3012015.1 TetR family transcriptional regulator [Nocardiopsis dassonvillei]
MDQRTRRRQRNRAAIQEAALRLFERQGYEATTVAQIAREAGVSHMTFFRCFPSKEDVVLRDEYDPMLEELVREQPDTLPAVERIHRATLVGLGRVYEDNREALLARARLLLSIPALRSRIGENLASASTAFERGLAPARAGESGPTPPGSGASGPDSPASEVPAPDPPGSETPVLPPPGTEPPDLETRAVAAACSAALSEAVIAWADSGGQDELPALVDRVFLALRASPPDHHRP